MTDDCKTNATISLSSCHFLISQHFLINFSFLLDLFFRRGDGCSTPRTFKSQTANFFEPGFCVGRTTPGQNRWSFALRPRGIHPNQASSLHWTSLLLLVVAVDAGVAVERQPLWCHFLPTVERKKVLIQTVWGEYVLFVFSEWLAYRIMRSVWYIFMAWWPQEITPDPTSNTP